jgi:hypothetical protein
VEKTVIVVAGFVKRHEPPIGTGMPLAAEQVPPSGQTQTVSADVPSLAISTIPGVVGHAALFGPVVRVDTSVLALVTASLPKPMIPLSG